MRTHSVYSLILRTVMNAQASHTTISKCCTNFALMFQSMAMQPIPALNINSNRQRADETVVKILGEKYYLRFIPDSETRFFSAFHLERHREIPHAFAILEACEGFKLVKPL